MNNYSCFARRSRARIAPLADYSILSVRFVQGERNSNLFENSRAAAKPRGEASSVREALAEGKFIINYQLSIIN